MESQFLEHFGEKEVVLINKEDLEADDSRDQDSTHFGKKIGCLINCSSSPLPERNQFKIRSKVDKDNKSSPFTVMIPLFFFTVTEVQI